MTVSKCAAVHVQLVSVGSWGNELTWVSFTPGAAIMEADDRQVTFVCWLVA